MKLQAERQEEFNEAIMAAQDPLKRLAQQFLRLITVSAPLIDAFTDILEKVVDITDQFMNAYTETGSFFRAITGSGVGAILGMAGALVSLISPLGSLTPFLIAGTSAVTRMTEAIHNFMGATTQENSLSFQQLFLTLPDLIDAAVAGIMRMVSAFSSLGQMVLSVGGIIKQALPDFLGGEANINVAGTTTTSGVLTANGAVAGAATSRNVINNTATTINNGGTAAARPQKAQINMTIDLGRNRVFQRAVQDVLYMEDK